MAKAGMRRPDPSDPHGTESNKKTKKKKNQQQPVPEIQGKAKTREKKWTLYYMINHDCRLSRQFVLPL